MKMAYGTLRIKFRLNDIFTYKQVYYEKRHWDQALTAMHKWIKIKPHEYCYFSSTYFLNITWPNRITICDTYSQKIKSNYFCSWLKPHEYEITWMQLKIIIQSWSILNLLGYFINGIYLFVFNQDLLFKIISRPSLIWFLPL